MANSIAGEMDYLRRRIELLRREESARGGKWSYQIREELHRCHQRLHELEMINVSLQRQENWGESASDRAARAAMNSMLNAPLNQSEGMQNAAKPLKPKADKPSKKLLLLGV